MDTKKYRIGIDVGSYSVGFAAIEVDKDGNPLGLLSCLSHIHDGGVDPTGHKNKSTRLAVSGVARRTRRLFRRRSRRLAQLDAFLEDHGFPLVDLEQEKDPYFPWRCRAELAAAPITDDAEMRRKLSVALCHIARHRGWRNPYSRVNTLFSPQPPSSAYLSVRKEVQKMTGLPVPEGATVGQMIGLCTFGTHKLRGDGGALCARLQQSDHANEIIHICRLQGISAELTKEIIAMVFKAESPKGSAEKRVGKDPLQPALPRALKATDAFQRYRIAALTGNLRIRDVDGNTDHPLSEAQRRLVVDHLVNLGPKVKPSWLAVADALRIDRGRLRGTATPTDDGERAGAQPPVHDTNRTILSCTIEPLARWWQGANEAERHAMLMALANGSMDHFDSPEGAKVQEFFLSLSDADHEALDSLHLPIGRAAYSEDTLRRLTARMLDENLNLTKARSKEFGIPEDWVPPAPHIGEPVGNPAVDRVLKATARWMESVAETWGTPESVTIEHVREGFMSASKIDDINRDIRARTKRNLKLHEEMRAALGTSGKITRADLWRYQSIQRQNGQCAYCGAPIDMKSAEMDHIVPRAGVGSTNTRANLIAVCHRCNVSKGKEPFFTWAERSTIPGVSFAEATERIHHWNADPGLNDEQFKAFKDEVTARLRRTAEDEPIDNRSIESVAWMANELRARIAQHFAEKGTGTKVGVYRGQLTAAARGASGLTHQLRFIGGTGKTRLDRRHHAVDAAVIAMMRPYVAEVLVQRDNLRFAQDLQREKQQWTLFEGADHEHIRAFRTWRTHMKALLPILQESLDDDQIPVTTNLRLRLANSEAHEATVHSFSKKGKYPGRVRVGDAMSLKDIDRASSEALWCALTRCEDFDWTKGLPENRERRIRVHGTWYGPEDTIELFPFAAAGLKVRGGAVEIGKGYHHARIYRIAGKKKPTYAMMRVLRHDLNKFRHEDLFSVELAPQTLSVRGCTPTLKKALREGTAEYVGWIVKDDEILIEDESIHNGAVTTTSEFVDAPIHRWRVSGFESSSKINLRPSQLSAEGLGQEIHNDVNQILVNANGWRASVNSVIPAATIVRRNAKGQERWRSRAHLPVCWKVEDDE